MCNDFVLSSKIRSIFGYRNCDWNWSPTWLLTSELKSGCQLNHFRLSMIAFDLRISYVDSRLLSTIKRNRCIFYWRFVFFSENSIFFWRFEFFPRRFKFLRKDMHFSSLSMKMKPISGLTRQSKVQWIQHTFYKSKERIFKNKRWWVHLVFVIHFQLVGKISHSKRCFTVFYPPPPLFNLNYIYELNILFNSPFSLYAHAQTRTHVR